MKIISFSQLGKYGRLGNQLFQIASTLGLAEKHGAVAAFPAWEYEPYFETPIPHGELQTNTVNERFYHHHEWGISGSCNLLGYLQSEKYFGSVRLKLKESFVNEQKEKMPEVFTREVICIQVRRGDYVGNPNYYQIPHVFYLSALLEYFPNFLEYNILFISDDIEYCRTLFEGLPNAYFSTGNSDIEDLALGSACDHFIISNSSFGWWCAWLGEKPNTKVIHSGHMYAGKLVSKNIKDYRPVRWIEYKRDSYKIPLVDVTFTIPVFHDHYYRKENLDLILYLLQSAFISNYIVMEQGGDKFAYTAAWSKYMSFDSDVFHRTRMLNQMAIEAETPFIANWDCDVIVPPAQILMAVLELRAGADVVYPYDGRFGRMPREKWFQAIQKSADIGIVRDTPFKGRERNHNSVGGAVIWNKESFIDAGMENERFVSFGPEDCERYDRMKILGLKPVHMRGTLFHMNHWVGPDSSPRNPHFAENEREYNKVHTMTRAQLVQYIDTWPWRNQYTRAYYHRISEGAILSAKIVFDRLGRIGIKPESVIDIGCGVGEWNNGLKDYVGVDHRIQKHDLLIPHDHFIDSDLNRDFPNILEKFDLCLCLEVAEHLRPSRADELIKYLCSLSDRVLFSAAIPNQGGTGHVNEQFQTYWARLFSENGFGAAKTQPDIRSCQDVELWYRQNIVLYQRGAGGVVKDFVLPEYYLQITNGLKG